MSKKLFLLDAYALIFRSYYAFIRNPRINSKGLNTSAIFGFVNTLEEVLREEDPSHIAVAFDPSGPTFRNEMYEEYKANRDATPEDIKKAIPYIKKILQAYHIPIIEKEGFEADDVIGTMAGLAEKEGFDVYMMTPDKDFAQLVTDKVYMYKPRKSGQTQQILTPEDVNEKYHIKSPEQVIDILALWGDSSDNVPGAPGVGEKTASKLVSEFGSVENLLENTDKLKGKQKERIEENTEQIKLSKQLVSINRNIPLEIGPDDLKKQKRDADSLKSIFEELEFNALIKRFFSDSTDNKKSAEHSVQTSLFEEAREEVSGTTGRNSIMNTEHDYTLVDTEYLRKELVKQIKKEKEFCFDTETSTLDPYTSALLGIAFSWKPGEAWYVMMPESKEETASVLQEFETVFLDEGIRKIGQNIKFDILVLRNHGLEVKGPLFDTMIAHYLLQPEQRHNMDSLAEHYLQYTPVSIESLIGKKGKKQGSMADVPLEKMVEYAGEDADITFQLKQVFNERLKKEALFDLFTDIECALIPVLAEMEYTGVYLDKEVLKEYSKSLKEELKQLETEIFELSGTSFNINSPKQLGEVLFEKLKITDKPPRTRTKQYATGEEVLQKLKHTHPVLEKILEYRGVNKLLNTYVEALPELINEETGMLHTSFNQTIAATGRLSSNNPNLQNIPIREERGRKIREAFSVKDKEKLFFSADYSQIELRLMAHMSKDPHMLDAFNSNDTDIHAATAAKIFKVAPGDVTRDMRSKAKTANFGIIYGISAFGLSQRLNIPRKEAKILIDEYFENFPGVKEYMDHSIKTARENEYVETIMGRRRYVPDINSRNAVVRGMAERNAINAPLQGSAADIIKVAMISIHREIQEKGYQTRMILQVHDELNFTMPESEKETAGKMIIQEMEKAASLSVPLVVEAGTGTNWLQAH